MSLRVSKRVAVLAALLSLVMGYGHLCSIRDAPQFKVPVLDELAYDIQAMGVLEGTWPAGKVFYQDPLYPYFLAAAYKTAGHRMWVVKSAQVVFGAAVVLFIFGICRRVFGPGTGATAAVITALYRPLYFFEGVLTKELLGLLLLSASLYFLVRAPETGKKREWLFSGLLLGAACLTRSNLLLMIPAWAAWAFFYKRREFDYKHRLAAATFFVAGTLVAITPVTIHNLRAGVLVLVTSQGGQNFYIGNHSGNIEGTYVAPSFLRANPLYEELDFAYNAEKKTGKEMTPSEISSYWYGRAWREICDYPNDSLRRFWRKALLVINDYEISDNVNFYYFRMRYSTILRLKTPGWGFWVALAIYGGLILLYRLLWKRDEINGLAAPILLMGVIYPATLVAFYVFARYRLPLLTVVPALAAFGLSVLLGYLADLRVRNLALAAAILAGLWMMTHKPLIEPDFSTAYYQTGNCLMKLGKYKEAEKEYENASILNANSAPIWINYAAALQNQGRYEEAVDRYRNALVLSPRNPTAHIGLADAYYALGKHEKSIEHYQVAMLMGSESSGLWTRLGRSYMALDMISNASSCLTKALLLDPDNSDAFDLLKKLGTISPR